jgi:acyl-CoA thioesterase I
MRGMLQYRVLGRALILLGLAFAACERASDREPSTASPPVASAPVVQTHLGNEQALDDRPRIVAFGDSLTAGFGVPSEASYPAQLQRRLEDAGYRYRVINAGVSGDTTAGGLRRVDWVLKSRPHIVILELGANDGLRGLDLGQIKTNLEQIIRRLLAAGVAVLLAGMKLPQNYGAEYTIGFAALFEELARAHRLPYMPFFLEGVGGQVTLNQADGIHPTEEGYRLIVDKLLPLLKPMLNKPQASERGPLPVARAEQSSDLRARQ